MKKYLMLAMVMLIGITSYCQNALGDTKAEVFKALIVNPNMSNPTETKSQDGTPMITAKTKANQLVSWYFNSDGIAYEYHLEVFLSDLNTYISWMNKTFVKDKDFQWIDYSTGYKEYGAILKARDHYYIVVTWVETK
jgi:hypothetical protein